MTSRVIAYGVPSALVLAGASFYAANQSTSTNSSPFDFNLTFMGETLSYKKNVVVEKVKEVGKEIKGAGEKVVGAGK